MVEYLRAADKLEFRKILNRLQSHAASDLGRRAAEHVSPFTSTDVANKELVRVDELKRVLESDAPLPLDGLHDIRVPLQTAGIENSILKAEELHAIAITLQASRNIKSFLQKRTEVCPELATLSAFIVTNKILEFNIIQAIDQNGLVKDTASKELKSIRGEIISLYDLLRRQLQRILRSVSEKGFTQDDIITTRDGRMVIPIRVEQKHQVPGFIHSSSASGSTVFVEPAETLALNNEIRELHFKEQREVERILRSLTLQVREVHLELLGSLEIVSHLDLIYAKAKYSIELKGNVPFLKESGSLKIREARHPVLLLHRRREDVVPLSIEIGGAYDTLLITGPNAGGKSVALKTVGILVLMVQSGVHVPASPDSEFPFFTKVHVDIGDDQSIENDLSTFSSHISRLKEIVSTADRSTLVLIDELGAGTDPVEGGALGAAILRELTKLGAYTIATTHQVSLKAFAHETDGMENGAMEFDQVSLLPTFKFRVGVPGSSYALEIARRLGLPDFLIAEAEKMTGEQKTHLEKLILDVESRSQNLSKQLQVVEAESLRFKQLTQEYETKLKDLKKESRSLKTKAIEEADEIIDKARSAIEQSIREIRQRQADRAAIKESRERVRMFEEDLRDMAAELRREEGHQIPDGVEIRKGKLVQLKSNLQIGEVVQAPDANGYLQVAFDNVKLKLHISEVVPTTSAAGSSRPAPPVPMETTILRELDVRGLYSEEALSAVDKFLDQATLVGLHRVDIIHGKGSGTLRKKIDSFLHTDKRIKSHRLGEWNEGGTGVTVVELQD